MAPKKDKGKGDKPAESAKGPQFTEVERTFLELQLAECNRKVARLRTAVDEYEARNEELQKAYDKLDEDRADIIAYLKKTLNNKNEENNELKDKVKGLEETREIETLQFKETVAELERNFTIMKDQLTSENKLLAGKLNTLEEFRAIRDDLMKKFEKQEQEFKDQEMKYKRIIYDAEKKFVVGKDKLKKEMEGRLLQLAQDFQDATELRIAASTHRVIRENIAINNELDSILSTQAKLAEQNENYKRSEQAARIEKELAEEERDKAINKNVVQLKVIDQLTTAFQNIKKEKAKMEKYNFDMGTLQTKVQNLTKENEQLSLQVRILEQNLHGKLNEQNKALVQASKVAKESKKMKNILKEAAIAIQAALKLDEWATTDKTKEIMDRQILLSRLLNIVTQYRETLRAESMDTLASLGKIYEEGDLGFVPKPLSRKSVTTLTPTQSRDSIHSMKRTSSSSLVSDSTLGSIRTVPSISILPISSEPEQPAKESLLSFVTSSKSSSSESAEESEEDSEEDDIQKKLEQSKLEIQKSIMKDLSYSQASFKSSMKLGGASGDKTKSVVIKEDVEEEGVEGEEGAEGEEGKEHIKGEMGEEDLEGEHKDGDTEEGDTEGGETVEAEATTVEGEEVKAEQKEG